MGDVKPHPSLLTPVLSRRLDPPAVGVACGMFAAVGYTAANICLRLVAHCDPVWVSTVKAVPTLILIGPWLLVLALRKERILPPRRVMACLLAAGLVAHLGGNVLFQWSLGVVGIALAVPLTLGTMIIAGAVLGRVFLGEGVTPRAAVANLVLLVAICILAVGASQTTSRPLPATGATTASMLAGVIAACVCGVAYSTLGVAIRYGVSGEARISTTMVSVSLVGLIGLGSVAAARLGMEGMLATAPRDLTAMALAGLFNAIAFLALTKALQLSSVVLVNALNASQTAMALAAGVLLFHEPLTVTLATGVILTAAGLLLMGNRRPKERDSSPENTAE